MRIGHDTRGGADKRRREERKQEREAMQTRTNVREDESCEMVV